MQAIRAALGRSMPVWEGLRAPPCRRSRSGWPAAPTLLRSPKLRWPSCRKPVPAFLTASSPRGCVARSPAAAPGRRGESLRRFRPWRAGSSTSPTTRVSAPFFQFLHGAIKEQADFAGLHVDYPREYWEAVRLCAATDLRSGLAEQARLNAQIRRLPPPRAISTIHKAKGLEAPNVMIMPCDGATFRENDRRPLYVAISRASRRLTLVVSRSNPSPIVET